MNIEPPQVFVSFQSIRASIGYLCLLMAVSLGCQSELSHHESERAHHEGEDAHHEDEHEHHEHEHFIPAHKPRDFRTCVARLQTLSSKIAAPEPLTDVEIDPITELSDLIRWLPEFATDSELDESSWNRVVAISEDLHSQVDPLQQLNSERRSAALANLTSSLQGPLAELQEFSASLPYYPSDDTTQEDNVALEVTPVSNQSVSPNPKQPAP